MYKVIQITMVCLLLLFSGGCAAKQAQSGSDPSYEQTKKMFVDMLKSDQGKKALRDILKEEEMKQALVLDHDFVKETLMNTVESKKGKQFWTELISDPKFSEKLAKSMQKNNEKLLKHLMKDPAYQEMMMSILKAPKMQEQYLDLMKTKPFREQMQTVVLDTISSPLFQEKMSKVISKAIEKQMKGQQGQEQSKQQSSNKSKGQGQSS
ncbi:spore germination lipoprotein GerD [Tuberibacillus sp. Marseille-P3662]|uniref:spore germination lipoprotein GerD n=1 Tax=Tuberibacillus sp. Marseille-P3662 TaxID=1965358 RepID=UPI000A1CD463|nr:spore germination lipoprotein GerD [Tuberibacillus sp. Marseille-P3662]